MLWGLSFTNAPWREPRSTPAARTALLRGTDRRLPELLLAHSWALGQALLSVLGSDVTL